MKKILLLMFLLLSIALSGQFNNNANNISSEKNGNKQVAQRNGEITNKSFLEKNTEQQRDLRQKISQTLREFKENRSNKVLFIALGIAFLYGIVHSLGPGHGKVFLVSQVIGSDVKYGAIIGSSMMFAFLHSLSGLTLVIVLKLLSMRILSDSTKFSMLAQNISFGILIALGLFILLKAIFGKEKNHDAPKRKNLFLTSIMIGFVPCPGSIIIAVFAMKMGVYSTGILMILAMALGMGFTLIALNSLTLFFKSLATKSLAKHDNMMRISKVMTIIGSSLLIALGTLFLYVNLGS